ncbi:MAG: hypothetical protein FWC26_12275 [Fibromonadales bacterium]|nr:hypothetical protein [Fibromonadales bacterium]
MKILKFWPILILAIVQAVFAQAFPKITSFPFSKEFAFSDENVNYKKEIVGMPVRAFMYEFTLEKISFLTFSVNNGGNIIVIEEPSLDFMASVDSDLGNVACSDWFTENYLECTLFPGKYYLTAFEYDGYDFTTTVTAKIREIADDVGEGTGGDVWDGNADIEWYVSKPDTTLSYTIYTAEQLAGFAQLVNGTTSLGLEPVNFKGKFITLGADIMLNDTTDWKNWATNPPDNEWIAIGFATGSGISPGYPLFRGLFNGNGKVIRGLYINVNNEHQGLFGLAYGANIGNLGLSEFYVKGNYGTGGIVGLNLEGRITNSYAIGNVSSVSSGRECVGGVTGSTDAVKNTYFVGNVSGNSNEDTGAITGCESSVLKSSIYNVDLVNPNSINSYGIGKSTSEMKDPLTYIFAGWEFGSIWTIDAEKNGGYPIFASSKNKQNIANAKVYLSTFIVKWTGKEVNPEASVYFNENKLDTNNYEVLYYNNIHESTATNSAKVIILGKGDYYGAIILDFFISEKKHIADIMIEDIPNQKITGDSLKPKPVIRDFGGTATLTEDLDYTLEYSDNVFEGVANITIRGLGVYEDSEVDITFNIIGKVYVRINWTTSCNTTFIYNGELQSPKRDTTKFEKYLTFEGARKDVGSAHLARVTTTNTSIDLQNNFCQYAIAPKPLQVDWTGPREFVYNKMNQSPTPSIDKSKIFAGDSLDFVLRANSAVGEYKDSTTAIYYINPQNTNANNYRLLDNRADYEIKKKPLNPYFSTDMQNFSSKTTDTLLVPYEIFKDSAILRTVLSSRVEYEGFATDITKTPNESDDKSVVKGKPALALKYYPGVLAKRVETTQKATATIITDNVSADNYSILSRPVVIVATIEERDDADKILCRIGYNCVYFSEEVCAAVSGKEVENCDIKVSCIVNSGCIENTTAESCQNIGGTPSETCDETPILTTSHLPLATSQIPRYYTLKGIPLGHTKPTISGIYIEKSGTQTKKVIVK